MNTDGILSLSKQEISRVQEIVLYTLLKRSLMMLNRPLNGLLDMKIIDLRIFSGLRKTVMLWKKEMRDITRIRKLISRCSASKVLFSFQIFYSYITALGNGTNPDFEILFRSTVGHKFFNKMSKLHKHTLNDL